MNKLRWWSVHLAIFAVGQGLLFAAGQSWPIAFLAGEVPDALTLFSSPAMWVSRMWCIVFAVDTVWSWSYAILPKKGKR
jgi:MFS transporter, DHA1 family, multidrug resistance protein